MSYIRIVSKRAGGTRARPGELVIAIDRRSNAILGNRHYLVDHKDASERARVIAENRKDEESDFAQNGPMSRELRRIAKIVDAGTPVAFVCWCAPEPCHGSNYRDRISKLLGRDVSPPDEKNDSQTIAEQGSLF